MPDWKEEVAKRLASLKLAPVREADIVEELCQHLDDRYRELLAEGLPPEEAFQTVWSELDGGELLALELRRVEHEFNPEPVVLGGGRTNMIADCWQDLRYAVRGMRKHALLSFIVVATLTLGIGISAGVFAWINAGVLRAQVDKDFDSFAQVYSAYTTNPLHPGSPGGTTLEDYLAYRDQAKSLRSVTAWAQVETSVGKEDPFETRVFLVDSSFFSVFDLERPLLGRLLQQDDCTAASPVMVLSERMWRNHFASDPEIVGKVVQVSGQPVTVVGVTPNFSGMYNGARAWLPYTLESYLKLGDNLRRQGESAWLTVAGRLNPGYSHRDAASEFTLLAGQQDQLHPGRVTTLTVTDGSVIQDPEARYRITLAVSVMVVALITLVLIVSVNVTTLLLSRSAARRREIAVRLALGAGRMRLVRMLLTETSLLSVLAGLMSIYLAYDIPVFLDNWFASNRWETSGSFYSLAPDWRVFGYVMLVTLLAGAMAGLAPTLQSLKVNLSEMLRSRQTMLGGTRGSRLYALLIGAQVALSFFLLYGAVICVAAARRAASFDSGFDAQHVLSIKLFVQSGAAGPRNWDAFHRALTDRIAALPGVQSVAYTDTFPFASSWGTEVRTPRDSVQMIAVSAVSPSYFDTLGIPIVSGRPFQGGDPPCTNSGCPVVISKQLAVEFFPNEDPIGKTMRGAGGSVYEVVGVAGDISMMRLGRADDPMMYEPLNSITANTVRQPFVRFQGDSAALGRQITAVVRGLAPDVVVGEPQTIQAIRDGSLRGHWREAELVIFLCVMAVAVAVIGIYGVVAFAVSQRTKEIGIRIALGAQKKDVYGAVLSSSGRPVVVGLVIGLVVTVSVLPGLTPILRNWDFTLNIWDPISFGVTAILLAAVALWAMLIPARRATQVDPIMALREE
ncbi:MAG TPA: ADOP family duplicated permease [Blastocatellia bacterium]|nr:ADOP family duplicated permease [Blastocatellia bacterium]